MRFDKLRRAGTGAVLPTALIVTAVIGMALGSYLGLVQAQRRASARSLVWNSTLPILEAGIEEALSQIRFNGTNRVANNGWKLVDEKYLMKSRTFGEGRYLVGISLSEPPIVFSQGFRTTPLSTKQVWRTVRVGTRLQSMFPEGMVADQNVNLNGQTIYIDSFDSLDPNHNTNGLYDKSKAKDNGNVVTNSQLDDSLNTGNAVIRGKVATGPGGSAEIGPGGSVGDAVWIDGGKKGIQPGAYSDETNIDIPPVVAPYTTGEFVPPAADVGGTNYNYVMTGGQYLISGKPVFGGKVLVSGHSTLVVTSNVQFSGQDYIYIAPNASLTLYVTCPTASISGLGVINGTTDATAFSYYGTATNTKLNFSGNAQFIGTIYAPNADFTMGGGGNNEYDFVGACVSKSVTMNGKFNFHYDEALRVKGPNRGYIPVSWDEISVSWHDILRDQSIISNQ